MVKVEFIFAHNTGSKLKSTTSGPLPALVSRRMEVVPAQEALTSDQVDLSEVSIPGDCCDDGGLGLWEKLPGCPASEIVEGEAENRTDCAFQSEMADLPLLWKYGVF